MGYMENIVVTKTSSEVTKCPTIGSASCAPVMPMMPVTCPYRVVGHNIARHMIPLYALKLAAIPCSTITSEDGSLVVALTDHSYLIDLTSFLG